MIVWRRILWTIQLVVFVTAGLFVAPTARHVQNATGQFVASTSHSGERVVASRERVGERVSRARSHQDSGPLACAPVALPVLAPAGFVLEAPRLRIDRAHRYFRFEPYAPRGPPQQG